VALGDDVLIKMCHLWSSVAVKRGDLMLLTEFNGSCFEGFISQAVSQVDMTYKTIAQRMYHTCLG
jgi:hypothetical protein